jgi:hypothetical protein
MLRKRLQADGEAQWESPQNLLRNHRSRNAVGQIIVAGTPCAAAELPATSSRTGFEAEHRLSYGTRSVPATLPEQ